MTRLTKGNEQAVTTRTKEENFIYVYSPRSGKRYRFYYMRPIKLFSKWTATIAGLALGGYLLMTMALNAMDIEEENRMQEQKDHFKVVEEHSIDTVQANDEGGDV